KKVVIILQQIIMPGRWLASDEELLKSAFLQRGNIGDITTAIERIQCIEPLVLMMLVRINLGFRDQLRYCSEDSMRSGPEPAVFDFPSRPNTENVSGTGVNCAEREE